MDAQPPHAESLIEKYKQALNAKPKDNNTLLNLGIAYASINKFKEAVEIFNNILQTDPKNLEALHNLGIVYTQLGKFGDAISKLEICVKLDPNKARFWNNLSEAYRRSGSYHQANVSRMRAIQINEQKGERRESNEFKTENP